LFVKEVMISLENHSSNVCDNTSIKQ